MEFARKENGFVTPQAKLRRLQFGCLLAALAMILAFFLLEDRASGVAYLLAERYLTVPAMVFLGISLCISLRKKRTGKSAETAGAAWIDLGILIAALVCGMFGLVGIGMAAAGAAVGAVLLVFDYVKGASPKEADKTE